MLRNKLVEHWEFFCFSNYHEMVNDKTSKPMWRTEVMYWRDDWMLMVGWSVKECCWLFGWERRRQKLVSIWRSAKTEKNTVEAGTSLPLRVVVFETTNTTSSGRKRTSTWTHRGNFRQVTSNKCGQKSIPV